MKLILYLWSVRSDLACNDGKFLVSPHNIQLIYKGKNCIIYSTFYQPFFSTKLRVICSIEKVVHLLSDCSLGKPIVKIEFTKFWKLRKSIVSYWKVTLHIESATMIKFSIFTFLHFRTKYIFPQDLANYQFIRIIRTRVFLNLYFLEFTAANNFPCSKSWLRIWVNDVIFSKISYGLKLQSQLVLQFS